MSEPAVQTKEEITSPKSILPLQKKLKLLKEIRHELKKKRFVLDEGKDRFGLDEFSQLMKVKNTSEVKGYPFKGWKKGSITRDSKIALKVVPVETKYEKNEHPCHLEHIILKDLTDNIVQKGISPHITYYLGTQKVSNKSRALKQLNLKRLEVSEKIRSSSSMLISEYVSGGSLDNWIFEACENDKEPSDEQWKNIVFQLVYTIAVIQHYYRMMHNDFHYGNILIDDTIQPGGYFVYEVDGKKFYIKNTGIIPKLWDFEFSMVYSNKISDCYPNKFITGPFEYDKSKHETIVDEEAIKDDEEVYNVPYNYNEVYDLHYFLTSLLDLYISQELFDWIVSIYPEELIPEEESDESDKDSSVYHSSTTSDSSDSSDSLDSSESQSSDESDTKSSTTSDSEESEESQDLDDFSDSDSDKESDTTDEQSCEDKDTNPPKYLSDGRMINGVEKQFEKLPTPISLLRHPFFQTFTEKPADFDEQTAIYFKAGF